MWNTCYTCQMLKFDFPDGFSEKAKIPIPSKSVQWERSCSAQTDRQT
jgi:hypothetical protein